MKYEKVKIENYVNLFFMDVPYSETVAKIKDKIIEVLSKKQEEGSSFDELVLKYNSLEKLCLVANVKKDNISKIKASDDITSLKTLKKEFKSARLRIYAISILCIIALVFLYNTIISFSYDYISSFLIFTLLMIILLRKYLKYEYLRKKEIFSLEAFNYLKTLHDKYLKKTYNTFFLSIILILYIIHEIILLKTNSKTMELFELINSMLIYIEIVLVLFSKNYLLNLFINKRIGNGKQKKFNKIFIKILFFSIVFIIVYLLSYRFIPLKITPIFIIFTIIYIIYALIFNFKYRKRQTYKNIVINKKRIITFVLLGLVLVLYIFMEKDFWLLQPFINSMPNIYEHNNKIVYDDNTGIYTITKQEEEFKILQLTDIHLGGTPISLPQDYKALHAVYKLIDYTKPDLVVVTGDLTYPVGISSFSFNNHTPVMQFASFMRNLGVPWAFTYGNHDTEQMATYSSTRLDYLYQVLSYKTSKNLLYPYKQPDITGRNNQIILIKNSDNTLNQALFLIDSNAYTNEGFNKYDYIHDDQVEWYNKNILKLNEEYGKTISSLLFFHIPLQEYRTAYELMLKNSDEVTYYFGENNEKMFNKICASDYPSKIFDEALKLESTKAFFCGHDHYNNMSLEYKGIRLTYGMSIDYLATPGISKATKQRGGTLITIYEDSTYDIKQVPLESIK